MGKFFTKKDFKNIINETASGFKPYYPSASSAQPSKPIGTETPIKKSDIKNSLSTTVPDYDKVELVHNHRVRSGKDWAENGGNFPIKRNGKIYWVSRSVSVSMYAFCQDKWGNWCVLANQRGPGCDNQAGLWNVPAGFLDYNENGAQAAVRETKEETGVDIPIKFVKEMGTNSDSETVRIRYSCVLPGMIDDYPTSDEYCEPGEVSAIAWIPTLDARGNKSHEITKYKWVRNPDAMVSQAQTMLSYLWDPKGFSKTPKERMIWHLRNEIRNNPKANMLLDKIIEYYENQK